MNILGLIPARSGSKGIKNKNIKLFNGKPLISYSIEASLNSKTITKTIVSTDSDEIKEIAESFGAEVPFLRPKSLAEDHVADFPVIHHTLNYFKENKWPVDIVVFLRPTNLFRKPEDIDASVNKLIQNDFDSVRSICKVGYSPYWMKSIENGQLVPFIKSEYEYKRRQELPETFQGNGVVEAIHAKTILKLNSIYGTKIGFNIMPESSRVDIDTPIDFEWAEFLYKKWKNREV